MVTAFMGLTSWRVVTVSAQAINPNRSSSNHFSSAPGSGHTRDRATLARTARM